MEFYEQEIFLMIQVGMITYEQAVAECGLNVSEAGQTTDQPNPAQAGF